MSSSSSSSGSRYITLLGHLQDYEDVCEKSHQDLKTSFWYLTKSRRKVGSGILGIDSSTNFTAELLREELQARVRLADNSNNNSTTLSSSSLEVIEAGDKEDSTTSLWTIVREEDVNSTKNNFNVDDERYRKDPIDLFYGHNQNLKVAQHNAQNALRGYIQAANQAAEILSFLQENQTAAENSKGKT